VTQVAMEALGSPIRDGEKCELLIRRRRPVKSRIASYLQLNVQQTPPAAKALLDVPSLACSPGQSDSPPYVHGWRQSPATDGKVGWDLRCTAGFN
jgi:hypothetical protein